MNFSNSRLYQSTCIWSYVFPSRGRKQKTRSFKGARAKFLQLVCLVNKIIICSHCWGFIYILNEDNTFYIAIKGRLPQFAQVLVQFCAHLQHIEFNFRFSEVFVPHFWKLMPCLKQFPLRAGSPRCIFPCLHHSEPRMGSQTILVSISETCLLICKNAC